MDYVLRIAVETAASSKHPDYWIALVAASESANDVAAVALGEIPLSKLLEISH